MFLNRMDLQRWSRVNPNCMYCDIGLHLSAQALLRVSHENRFAVNDRHNLPQTNYKVSWHFFGLS
jgi:hypothetical protein